MCLRRSNQEDRVEKKTGIHSVAPAVSEKEDPFKVRTPSSELEAGFRSRGVSKDAGRSPDRTSTNTVSLDQFT